MPPRLSSSGNLSVPGWFLTVVGLVTAILFAGYNVGSEVAAMRSDAADQARTTNQRLCRIEFQIGVPPWKTCDYSQFLINRDDTKTRFLSPSPQP